MYSVDFETSASQDDICRFAGRLRLSAPFGFPQMADGLPAAPLPTGFWLPWPTLQAFGCQRSSRDLVLRWIDGSSWGFPRMIFRHSFRLTLRGVAEISTFLLRTPCERQHFGGGNIIKPCSVRAFVLSG